MNVLVTGGAGFIGSHLVERCLSEGWQVTVLDQFEKGKREAFVHAFVRKNKKGTLSVFSIDLTDAHTLPTHFRGVDWVFHLAGASDIIPSILHPLEYHATNVTATINVLEASRKAGIKRFIYAASSSCYGIPDMYPTPETAAIKPQYPYALTKYLGELYCLHWANVYKLPVVSLRLFNVFGPRVRVSNDYGPVFSTFMAQKLAGKPLTVVGNGRQTRDFTFVSDVVDAFIAAATSNVVGDVFNVGSGGTYSIHQLVALIGGPFMYIPKRPGEPDCTRADIRKIKKILGWKPNVSFEEGVTIVLDHIDEWKDAPVWTPARIRKATKDWFTYLDKK